MRCDAISYDTIRYDTIVLAGPLAVWEDLGLSRSSPMEGAACLSWAGACGLSRLVASGPGRGGGWVARGQGAVGTSRYEGPLGDGGRRMEEGEGAEETVCVRDACSRDGFRGVR